MHVLNTRNYIMAFPKKVHYSIFILSTENVPAMTKLKRPYLCKNYKSIRQHRNIFILFTTCVQSLSPRKSHLHIFPVSNMWTKIEKKLLKSIGMVLYANATSFSAKKKSFQNDYIQTVVLYKLICLLWKSHMHISIFKLFNMHTKFENNLKQEGPWPWITHLSIQAKIKHLTLKSEWPLRRSKNDLDLWYSLNFINSFSWMHQATLRPKAAIVS